MTIGPLFLFRNFLRYTLIVFLLIALYFWFYISPFWVALTVLVFTLAETCHPMAQIKNFFLVVLTALVTLVVTMLLCQINFILLSLYLAFLSGTLLWYRDNYKKYPEIFLSILLFNFLLVAGHNALSVNMIIIASVLLGFMVIIFVKLIFFPLDRYYKKIDLYCAAMQALINLNDDIFACLLQGDYRTRIYLYERRIHNRKRQFGYALKQIDTNDENVSKIKSTYNDLLDIGQLRNRVDDYSTFSLCQPELKNIASEIKALLQAINYYFETKMVKIDLNAFSHAVNRLNDNYHHVLQIAAKDPLVFALCIQGLNRLPQNWITFFHDVSKSEEKHDGK